VGFKNNQSYGRLWEARRLWDEITGQSRQLAVMVKNYRSEEAVNQDESNSIRQQIIFRHIAYIYQLRKQLLEPAIWEHVSLCRS
jgi:putative membrane protein